MANNSYTQQRLAADPLFRPRVRAALATVASQVLAEDPETAFHEQRENYARTVINNLEATAAQISGWLVHRPNLFAFETTFDFEANGAVTASGDADIQSQLATDWNVLAGV